MFNFGFFLIFILSFVCVSINYLTCIYNLQNSGYPTVHHPAIVIMWPMLLSGGNMADFCLTGIGDL